MLKAEPNSAYGGTEQVWDVDGEGGGGGRMDFILLYADTLSCCRCFVLFTIWYINT